MINTFSYNYSVMFAQLRDQQRPNIFLILGLMGLTYRHPIVFGTVTDRDVSKNDVVTVDYI